jgi:hypothetical protein
VCAAAPHPRILATGAAKAPCESLRVYARLLQLKDQHAANRQRRLDLAPLPTSNVVIEADRFVGADAAKLTLLSLWRMCSAAALMLLEREKIAGVRTDTHLITSSWAFNLLPLTVAVNGLAVAIEGFETHAQRTS